MEKTSKLVAVHDGTIHFDEALSVAMLKLLFNVTIIRTRDILKLDSADIRVDVGGRFDPETGDFDHHQPDAPRRPNGIKYAAAGLLWLVFGERICGDKDVADFVDRIMIQSGDAADNGETPWKHIRTPMAYTVSFMAEAFNPTWLEPESTEDAAFERMVEIADLILERNIAQAKAAVAARDLIRRAAAKRDDPRILVLDRKLPWQNTVAEEFPEIRYVVYDDGKYWGVRSVPTSPGSPDPQFPLPEVWAGKTAAGLAAAAGVHDALFCHVNRFIATAGSREGAMRLAELACI